MVYLIGQGNDTHELTDMRGATIVLGGYKLKTNCRVISHSDGDIVLHAIANAILGALQLGDIGLYFKDTDYKTKNMDSVKIVKFALDKLKKSKFKLVNVDLTITCENIIFGKYKKFIQESICKILGIKLVNVKATRFEHPSNLIKCDAALLINK
ncbi:MAG: 2-C-methyl-D-erythritol 2,4-cyclodiphosphate synthase [Mycoplasmataceae bacterium]|jgi:2-C-methyl-D-erythritol 2,4-cyclodiphosphate synthase|nr:2-C-methyl-D-erythritol 2,4-cyclodiphosphate synthase [Mycoplasmataceae bacterium]